MLRLPRAFPILALALGLVPSRAQILHANAPLPSFEVATIKPWQRPPSPPSGVLPVRVDPSSGKPRAQTSQRVHMILPVNLLIAAAYGLPPSAANRIVGGPEWLRQGEQQQYEIEARIDDASYAALTAMPIPQQREQIALMEQSLLADRLKLKVHFESREMPAYTLVAAKGGPKLTPAPEGELNILTAMPHGEGNGVIGKAVTMAQLSRSVLLITSPSIGGRPVVDRTGLSGAFDFTLRWSADPQAASDAGQDAPSLFTALQEQLGLKLVPAREPVELIVVEHIELPSAN